MILAEACNFELQINQFAEICILTTTSAVFSLGFASACFEPVKFPKEMFIGVGVVSPNVPEIKVL